MKLKQIIANKLKPLVVKAKFLRKFCVSYCAYNELLPEILVKTPPARLRSLLGLPESAYLSELNQDIFALLMNRFAPGFFVEIGANDGFTLSNTAYLEEHFGWDGLLVEANPEYEESLKRRKAKSVIAAITNEEGYYEFCGAGLYGGVVGFLDERHAEKRAGATRMKVWGTTLANLLAESGAPQTINFISIDVEGAEVSIVEQMCHLKDYHFVWLC